MKNQSSYSLTNSGISSLKIEYSKAISSTVDYAVGWNMISVPVRAETWYPGTFPSSNSLAYGFNNGYYSRSVSKQIRILAKIPFIGHNPGDRFKNK